MIFFITVLRALAACMITNAHYTGVYPTDLIANGGLIGDILFFAVSGYCLYQIKDPFWVWYKKRLSRVYPAVWIFTIPCLLLGIYSLDHAGLVWWMVYPTYYHFIGSIILLYAAYYCILHIKILREHLLQVMLVIFGLYMLIYIFLYDKTYYHIDVVREPMIRFLFLESMLLGGYFKANDSRFRNHFSITWIFTTVLFIVIYFGSKLFFSRNTGYMELQFLNQITIFMLLYAMLRLFAGLDSRLQQMPTVLKKIVEFIASITLEIYIVQYVLIEKIRPLFSFPLNWIVLTGSIVFSAYILHKIDEILRTFGKRYLVAKK